MIVHLLSRKNARSQNAFGTVYKIIIKPGNKYVYFKKKLANISEQLQESSCATVPLKGQR